MQFGVRRIINSVNYHVIGRLTGRDSRSMAARTDMLREWARRLDFEVELIKEGDQPYVPLSKPIKFESGITWTDRAPIEQSVCVLVRK